jgi:thiol-disulfide isomerase/thioredoxin
MEIYFFYSNSCQYCVKYFPTWIKLKKLLIINGIKFIETNNPKKMAKYNVNGIPTILMIDKKKNIIKNYENIYDIFKLINILNPIF